MKIAVNIVLHQFQKSLSHCQSFCLLLYLTVLLWDVLHNCSVGLFKRRMLLNSSLWVTVLCTVYIGPVYVCTFAFMCHCYSLGFVSVCVCVSCILYSVTTSASRDSRSEIFLSSSSVTMTTATALNRSIGACLSSHMHMQPNTHLDYRTHT